MDPNDHRTLPQPGGSPQGLPQQPQWPPQNGSAPQSGSRETPPLYGQPSYTPPPPTYASPFPAAPRPVYPYQPIVPNPYPNGQQVNPQLPAPNVPPANTSPRPAAPPPALEPQYEPASRRAKVIITVVFILMLAIAGGLAYLFAQAKNDKPAPKKPSATQPAPQPKEEKKEEPAQEPEPEKKSEPAPELAPQPTVTALAGFMRTAFTAPPSVPAAFTPFDYKTPGVTAYVTEGRACELQFGVLGADKLPGSDGADVARRQVDALRAGGATVSDPVAQADLKLRHTDDAHSFFTLPSFSFTAVLKGGLHVRSHYAVTVLKDGSRAYVLRTCNAQSAVDANALDAAESLAGAITLKPAN